MGWGVMIAFDPCLSREFTRTGRGWNDRESGGRARPLTLGSRGEGERGCVYAGRLPDSGSGRAPWGMPRLWKGEPRGNRWESSTATPCSAPLSPPLLWLCEKARGFGATNLRESLFPLLFLPPSRYPRGEAEKQKPHFEPFPSRAVKASPKRRRSVCLESDWWGGRWYKQGQPFVRSPLPSHPQCLLGQRKAIGRGGRMMWMSDGLGGATKNSHLR